MAYTFDDDLVSDLHKDAWGMRPSEGFWQNWKTMTDAEKQKEWDWMIQVMESNERQRQEDEVAAVVRFTRRIDQLIECGARNRAMAIRWLHEAYETHGDDEYLAWHLGLPYGFFRDVAISQQ